MIGRLAIVCHSLTASGNTIGTRLCTFPLLRLQIFLLLLLPRLGGAEPVQNEDPASVSWILFGRDSDAVNMIQQIRNQRYATRNDDDDDDDY